MRARRDHGGRKERKKSLPIELVGGLVALLYSTCWKTRPRTRMSDVSDEEANHQRFTASSL